MREGSHKIWQIGEWRINPALGEMFRNGRTTQLDPRAMRLLMFLAERPGEVVRVTDLLEGVWGPAVVTPHSVYEAIAALRHALEESGDGPAYIVTLPRRGYRLVAAVATADCWHKQEASEVVVTGTAAKSATTPPLANVPVPARPARRITAMALAVVVACASLLIWIPRADRVQRVIPKPDSQKSIAVLSFVDISEKHDQGYFAQAMAEDLLNLLIKVPGLRVMTRTSSFQFNGREENLPSLKARLGVGYIIEGSVRRSADNLRVTAQLLSAKDGSHLWAETYDRKVEDALQVQSEIAYGIARAMDLTIAEDNATLTRAPLRNAEAYNIYLKGRHAVDRYDRAGFEEGAADFKQALQLDPTFAPAALWLAWALTEEAEYSYTTPTSIEAGRTAAQLAARLDPSLAMAHSILASIHVNYDWDWAAADRELRLALALEPHNVWPILVASERAAVFGLSEEAVRYNKEAIALSPLDPVNWESLGYHLLWAGRLDEAEAAIRKALEMRSTIDSAHSMLGIIHLLRGELKAASAEFEHEKNNADGGPNYGGLACVYHALGRHAESDRMLARVAQRGESVAYYLAQIHAFRGEPDAAFEWLERAYLHRNADIIFIKTDPLLKSLASDKRYDELLRRLNLPKQPAAS
ncbi:MAG TPA: winged helix-turn-helix domain-containing protein [Steroidobacteraceae bacterium]|nr:winged helix-turn-helix domain-containing protein [Steroidobacteraceae bacterium]